MEQIIMSGVRIEVIYTDDQIPDEINCEANILEYFEVYDRKQLLHCQMPFIELSDDETTLQTM